MNRETVQAAEASPSLSRPTLRHWMGKARDWLYPYRPRFRNRRFWIVQGLVILIAATHDIVEYGGFLHNLRALYFVPVSVFFVPVIYAGLSFGFAGSVATLLWVVVINIPNWVYWHEGLERWGEIFQMLVLVGAAFFAGHWIEREKRAQREAELANAALRASEIKYRQLFESSPIPILVLDAGSDVIEANPSASALFARDGEALKNLPVADLLGLAGARKLLDSFQEANNWQAEPLVFGPEDGPKVYLEPAATQIKDGRGNVSLQVLLRDVTADQRRRAGLRAYAAYMMRAQEEERQRIARELHDETIQDLILLCRQLDLVKEASLTLPRPVIDGLGEARRSAEETVKGLRELIRALRPPTLDDLGTVVSVGRLLAELRERAQIEGWLRVVGEERRLPPAIELGLFRIAQEALRNVERHARATEVVVTIAFAEGEVMLDVVDNGVGFDMRPAQIDLPATGQLGLIGMQERAELLGGRVEIHSGLGRGTRVSAHIPLGEGNSKGPGHRSEPSMR